ncbi:permease [Anaerovorax odorimutans]|uniref:permease n=1 Tax=Anaerovorax odorimutans TaxID=109327 RepID=UPI0004266514|nr:permease [Anaerovorax odorimutans]
MNEKMKGMEIGLEEEIYSKDKEKRKKDKTVALSIIIMVFALCYIVFSYLRTIETYNLSLNGLKVFNTIFISILMQAFPFMLVGVFVASALHVFVPDDFIVKVFPRKYGLGFLTAMFGGILFPVCECAIVPVMTGLVKKGVALPIALTFMFSAPIINPIVILSTLYAFPGQPQIALLRVIFGLMIALIIGVILFFTGFGEDALKNVHDIHHTHDCSCVCCGHNHVSHKISLNEKLKALFLHSGEEFFGVGRYLVLGAFITSLIQAIIPREVFINLYTQNGLSLFIMMAAAFLFSACSTSDAFIARSFIDKFSIASIMGFMVFGPMMDIKNIFMLLGSFKKKFVFGLCIFVFFINFIMIYFMGTLFL